MLILQSVLYATPLSCSSIPDPPSCPLLYTAPLSCHRCWSSKLSSMLLLVSCSQHIHDPLSCPLYLILQAVLESWQGQNHGVGPATFCQPNLKPYYCTFYSDDRHCFYAAPTYCTLQYLVSSETVNIGWWEPVGRCLQVQAEFPMPVTSFWIV